MMATLTKLKKDIALCKNVIERLCQPICNDKLEWKIRPDVQSCYCYINLPLSKLEIIDTGLSLLGFGVRKWYFYYIDGNPTVRRDVILPPNSELRSKIELRPDLGEIWVLMDEFLCSTLDDRKCVGHRSCLR